MYGCTGVQVPPLSYILFPCSGLCWHALPFSLLLETIGTTWNTGVQVPPFHTFYSHALGCAGMRCHSPYYWKLLEPPGTYTTLDPRILLDVPHPHYLKCMAALVCRPPHFHTFYSHALGCVGMRCHSPYYWKLLEPPGTPRILLDVPHPQYLKCMAALVCRSPPFIHFIPMLWAVLACVAILPTTGNYWNHLELLRFSWMCLTPSTWNVWLHWCAGPPPLSYILFPCSGLCWDALLFSLLLETIGTTWNSLDSPGCPTPSTWNVWLHWCAGPPPFIHLIPMLWAVLACVAILPTTGN